MNDEQTFSGNLGKINNISELDTAIKRLERKKLLLEENLKDDFHTLLQSLKPTNILKNTIHEVQESPELKHNLLKVVLGLGAGYFSRKLVVGKSAGIVKKALGAALQYGITSFVAKKNGKEEESGLYSKKKNLFKRILSI
ncbi:MAG TPA: hypothetical protein VF301_00660 [Ginsengibacter sp.]